MAPAVGAVSNHAYRFRAASGPFGVKTASSVHPSRPAVYPTPRPAKPCPSQAGFTGFARLTRIRQEAFGVCRDMVNDTDVVFSVSLAISADGDWHVVGINLAFRVDFYLITSVTS